MPSHPTTTGRRLGVVTTMPPGTGSLGEYGLHLVGALADKPDVRQVVVLTDHLPDGLTHPDRPGVRVVPCWGFNRPGSAIGIVRAARRERLDTLVWSLQFASFGDRRVAAALGLLAPLLARMAGIRNVVLLHHLMETVDMAGAGFGMSRLAERVTRLAGWLVTRAILAAGRVVVTMPQYLQILRRRYGARDIAVVPHGTFEVPLCDPTVPEGPLRLLAFGKFGTYKTVEPLLEAARVLRTTMDVEVVVAGTDSPNAPGYLADVQQRYPEATYTGYVAEEDLAGLFGSAALVVFPYTHTTGSSGVVHQAAGYSRALVMPDIGDFRRLVESEGYVGTWFDPTDPTSLEAALARALSDPEALAVAGTHNHAVAAALPIHDIAEWYLAHVEQLASAQPSTER